MFERRCNECDLQGSLLYARSNVGSVRHGTQLVRSFARDTHGKAGEGGNTGVDIVGSEVRLRFVPDGVDGAGVVDADRRTIPQLDAAIKVDALDVARGTVQQCLGDGDLGSNGDTIDNVACDFAVVPSVAAAAGDEVLEANKSGWVRDLEVLGDGDGLSVALDRAARVEFCR